MSIRNRAGTGLAVLALVLATACEPVYRGHGYAPKPDQLAQISVGLDTQATVREKIGRPGGSGLVNRNAWYYVGSTVEHFAYEAPKVVDRTVVAIHFDANGIVTDVKQYGIADGKVIDLVTRTTPTYGKELTIVQQLLGDILNFNAGSLLSGQ
jgi:outer membrane protein assembly factor BamE (lipoprotein component of BamABCDE complex)